MLANASLEWVTPEGDDLIAKMARVSNPENQDNKKSYPRLIKYLMMNGHWSPFEMVSMCVEIETTRDIGRQILRHVSFRFQEFSGRYAAYDDLHADRECRLQDETNRQSSIMLDPDNPDHAEMYDKWTLRCRAAEAQAQRDYRQSLNDGVAKECARALLPEGMVPTTMYMTGTIRSWIHYLQARTYAGAQREHQLVALKVQNIFSRLFPMTYAAMILPAHKDGKYHKFMSSDLGTLFDAKWDDVEERWVPRKGEGDWIDQPVPKYLVTEL
ncbi:FAD-dependent thymidylate synthase [uncultured Sulfitobacter sp.]|uniref:FAD-dependent thymidylate synthase n=1 Tax=uncultured Sulfitobacter sp. TaxID=191468 RepID=UPI0025951FBF|nr:FAD-dependent thymidylate synthase [uncultured Sulfitobacter sp.]